MNLYFVLDTTSLYIVLTAPTVPSTILFPALTTLTSTSDLLSRCFLSSLPRCSLGTICNHHGRSNPNNRRLPCNQLHSLRRHQLCLYLLLNIFILPPGRQEPAPQMVSHRRGPGNLRRRSASSRHQI